MPDKSQALGIRAKPPKSNYTPIKRSCFAACEIALIIIMGIAINQGHGVVTINTARNRMASFVKYQVSAANKSATGAKTAPI